MWTWTVGLRRLRAVPPGHRAALVWAVGLTAVSLAALVDPHAHSVYQLFSTAGRQWCAGQDAYAEPGYRYCPATTVFFAAPGALPDRFGGLLWRWLGAGLFLGGFAYASRVLDPTWAAKSPAARHWVWLLLLPLAGDSLRNGQANPHVAGLLLIAAAGALDARWWLAAACLAAATLLKVYPGAVALLLVALFPGRLGPRFALALAAGALVPFLTQSPGFVSDEYRRWAGALAADDRYIPQTGPSYRDLSKLLYAVGVPITRSTFLPVQAGAGLAAAAACLYAKYRLAWGPARLLRLAYLAGSFWMLLCGPATEACTFILAAPAVAWLTVDAVQGRFGRAPTALVLAGTACLLTAPLQVHASRYLGLGWGLDARALGTLLLATGWIASGFGPHPRSLTLPARPYDSGSGLPDVAGCSGAAALRNAGTHAWSPATDRATRAGS